MRQCRRLHCTVSLTTSCFVNKLKLLIRCGKCCYTKLERHRRYHEGDICFNDRCNDLPSYQDYSEKLWNKTIAKMKGKIDKKTLNRRMHKMCDLRNNHAPFGLYQIKKFTYKD